MLAAAEKLSYSPDANAQAMARGHTTTLGLIVHDIADPYFSATNTWLGNPAAQGHCGAALKDNPRAAVLLVPGAPHTLLNLPAARMATAGFLAGLARTGRQP